MITTTTNTPDTQESPKIQRMEIACKKSRTNQQNNPQGANPPNTTSQYETPSYGSTIFEHKIPSYGSNPIWNVSQVEKLEITSTSVNSQRVANNQNPNNLQQAAQKAQVYVYRHFGIYSFETELQHHAQEIEHIHASLADAVAWRENIHDAKIFKINLTGKFFQIERRSGETQFVSFENLVEQDEEMQKMINRLQQIVFEDVKDAGESVVKYEFASYEKGTKSGSPLACISFFAKWSDETKQKFIVEILKSSGRPMPDVDIAAIEERISQRISSTQNLHGATADNLTDWGKACVKVAIASYGFYSLPGNCNAQTRNDFEKKLQEAQSELSKFEEDLGYTDWVFGNDVGNARKVLVYTIAKEELHRAWSGYAEVENKLSEVEGSYSQFVKGYPRKRATKWTEDKKNTDGINKMLGMFAMAYLPQRQHDQQNKEYRNDVFAAASNLYVAVSEELRKGKQGTEDEIDEVAFDIAATLFSALPHGESRAEYLRFAAVHGGRKLKTQSYIDTAVRLHFYRNDIS